MSKIKKVFYLFLPIILGSLVGLLISKNIDYGSLAKPLFAPPKILFPIAWSIIYLLLGLSYYLYKRKGKDDKRILYTYYISLTLKTEVISPETCFQKTNH